MAGRRFHPWIDPAYFRYRIRTYILGAALGFLLASPTTRSDDMTSTIVAGNSRIDVTMETSSFDLSHDQMIAYVQAAVDSISAYYGRYPVPHVTVHLRSFDGEGVRGGRTFGEGDPVITMRIGSHSSASDLAADWTMTHEMVHLAFPSMAENHHWMEEGSATYVEPIARVRARHFDALEMWREVVRDMHQGLPQPGDQGLDNTHTWGRTYWGGALFCLLADIEIRQKTGNRKGLEDAFRGILNAGGDIREDWPIEKALKAGDDAVGVTVLLPLYEKMKDQPNYVDLDALWAELGVEKAGETIRFVDSAPLANIRKAITYGTPTVAEQSNIGAPLFSTMAGRAAHPFWPPVPGE